MKKIIAILTAAMMITSLAACANSGGSSASEGSGESSAVQPTEAPALAKIADDADIMNMKITPPTGYKTVERFISKASDGKYLEKSLTYEFEDKSQIILGYTANHKVEDEMNIDDAETIEQGGVTYYLMENSSTIAGLAQVGSDIYGVGYSFAESADKEAYNKLLSGVSFNSNTSTVEDNDDMFDINYTLDSTLAQCSSAVTQTETSDGTLVKKTVSWCYGEDPDKYDYKLLVRVYKDTTIEEINKDSSSEFTQETVNGITYTVQKPSSDDKKPFSYLTQHGTDVYQLRNNGDGGSWVVNRSEESEAAFEKLLNSVSFK